MNTPYSKFFFLVSKQWISEALSLSSKYELDEHGFPSAFGFGLQLLYRTDFLDAGCKLGCVKDNRLVEIRIPNLEEFVPRHICACPFDMAEGRDPEICFEGNVMWKQKIHSDFQLLHDGLIMRYSLESFIHFIAAGFWLFKTLDAMNTDELDPVCFGHWKSNEDGSEIGTFRPIPFRTRTQRIRVNQATNQLIRRMKAGGTLWEGIKTDPLNPKK